MRMTAIDFLYMNNPRRSRPPNVEVLVITACRTSLNEGSAVTERSIGIFEVYFFRCRGKSV
jgi:hypothetical protein